MSVHLINNASPKTSWNRLVPEGLQRVGEDWLLTGLTKSVLEAALEAER